MDLPVVRGVLTRGTLGPAAGFLRADLFLAALLTNALPAHWLIADSTRRFLTKNPFYWADMVVIRRIVALVVLGSLAFLRTVRIAPSCRVLQDFRQDSRFLSCNEDVIQRSVKLGVFILINLRTVHPVQSVFRPSKVRQKYQSCGLLLHDAKAVRRIPCDREFKIEAEKGCGWLHQKDPGAEYGK